LTLNLTDYIWGRAFKVLQVISESMRRIRNMFRQNFCEFEGNIRWLLLKF